ncbi:MAG: RidA family protein, partial [Chloroflexi bacterium]|nr:RidA family protein [Chloroflexota bacterium]
MPEIERKLNEMGYELPPPRTTLAGNFVPAVRTGNLVYLSGHGPALPEGGFSHVGKVGQDLSID